mmetsp:Transcript_74072/g.66655  ORF Transcript_74072/g.66655 Transcript_74072/m.66655 type:complete len:151 (-) Transcript_74072:8-460(-)
MFSYLLVSILLLCVYSYGASSDNNCPADNSFCRGKSDGNYRTGDGYSPNYYVACSNGLLYCMPCPSGLVFVPGDDNLGSCQYPSQIIIQNCPSDPFCVEKPNANYKTGIGYSPYHYVSCWNHKVVGCTACPSGMIFIKDDGDIGGYCGYE